MTNSQKIEIAKEFIDHHKKDDVIDWQPVGTNDDNKYTTIYGNLTNDTYGEVRQTGFDNELEVEISGFETKTGNPYLFTWEDSGFVDYLEGNV